MAEFALLKLSTATGGDISLLVAVEVKFFLPMSFLYIIYSDTIDYNSLIVW
jgi:hypothetical protein